MKEQHVCIYSKNMEINYRKTIFLAIAFGTSVRDVLRNDSYRKLKANPNNQLVVFAQDTGKAFENEFGGDNVSFEKLIPYKPTVVERVLIHFHKALLRDRCRTIDLGNTAGDTALIDKLTPLARIMLHLFGKERMNSFLDFLYRRFTSPRLYKDQFTKYKPDLVVVTRVLNYSMDYQILRQAAAIKVPVIALVSSWDNLSSKGFFPFGIRSLVVWNHIMKNEAIDLFNFDESKIKVVGIPRYDLLFTRHGFTDRDTFFLNKRLDISKRLITYATGSKTTGTTAYESKSPEPLIVDYIVDQINNGNIPNAQLLVRLHPQADPNAYQFLANRKSVILHIPGQNASFQDRLFSEQDDVELGETMLYSNLVINFASTISIDAAMFDTPIICVDFDFTGQRPFAVSMRRLYHFDHYRKLLEMGGIRLSSSKAELIHDINDQLNNPNQLMEGRQRMIDQQCVYRDGKSGLRIASHIESVLSEIRQG